MTPEQKMNIERLYENESLTDNLNDADAKGLLQWAEQQITANTKAEVVTAAVQAANASGAQGVQALVSQASAFLAQAVAPGMVSPAAENSGQASSPAAGAERAATPPTEASPPAKRGAPPAAQSTQAKSRPKKKKTP